MNDLNNLSLTGRVTRDAELKHTPGGTAVSTFGVASNRSYKKGGDEDFTKDTLFLDVTIWGKSAENKTPQLKKGAPVYLMGRLELDQWEQDGNKRSKISCVAQWIAVGKAATEATAKQTEDDVPFDV